MTAYKKIAGGLLLAGWTMGCGGGGGAVDQGTICAYDADCAEHCVTGLGGQAPYCTGACDTEAGVSCPEGYYCLVSAQAGLICAMGSCTSDEECPQSYTCEPDDEVCVHEPVTCTTDTDCPANVGCNQGECVLRCESDDGCKQGFYCQYHTRCVQCTINTHCTGGYACSNGLCNQECIGNGQCRDGYRCTGHGCAKIVGGGTGAIGAACTDHIDCVDFCRNTACARACGGVDDTTSCPAGYSCNAGHGLCEPD